MRALVVPLFVVLALFGPRLGAEEPPSPTEEVQLLAALRSAEGVARDAAARRLGELRSVRAIPALVELFVNEPGGAPESPYLTASGRALAAIGAPAVPLLLDHVKHEYPYSSPAWVILWRKRHDIVPALIERLSDAQESRRVAALGVLRWFAYRGVRAAGEISAQAYRLLDDPAPAVRVAALKLLRAQRDCVPFAKLAAPLRDRDKNVRETAQDALTERCELSVEHLPELIELLEDREAGARPVAIVLLAKLGERGVGAILERFGSLDEEDTGFALSVLAERKTAAAVSYALKVISDRTRSHVTRVDAVRYLGQVAPDDARAVETLLGIARDTTDLLHPVAVGALGRQRQPGAESLAIIFRSLDASDVVLRHYARNALGRLGPAAARPLVAELRRRLDGDDPFARERALAALRQIGAPEAVPELVKLLSSPRRVDAFFDLARIGPPARSALPDHRADALEHRSERDGRCRLRGAPRDRSIGRGGGEAPPRRVRGGRESAEARDRGVLVPR